MIALSVLAAYCDDLLQVKQFKDYCPNGLQIEAGAEVRRIVGGVTASKAIVDQAVKKKADVLLVHHGYFWRGEPEPIVGIKGARITSLIKHDVSLLAYHLPLDAHPLYGNNAQLASLLGLQVSGAFGGRSGEVSVGLYGSLELPQTAEMFAARLESVLGRKPLHIKGHDRPLSRIAWCSGAAQNYFEQAIHLGVDAFFTGEVSEQSYHLAKEYGVDFFSAGHHATERYGVKALGAHLAEQFDLHFEFVDLDNPV
ncbi:MAG: Nif3-like dinuclear metal center hexameric protein [Gammaproteobacteria bacterium]|nr:Nif3-like dinuclear metal center hexameric protein [Gammaproteobacteria bacterium]